ncbi:tRNA (guanosine(37)-N1)-methyltransferase TrmD [Candidatus Parcubacteria bacterium]|nr:tRNA (guanosine(37)-N1)-methyltransferase TrmD [Candidatus Parcubacteria bacterium]
MHFHIVTLFPKAFDSYLGESILKRAIEDKKIKVSFYNPRDFTKDKWKRIDRPPYAGGPGMVIQAEPVAKAIDGAIKKIKNKKYKIILLSPSGKQFTNEYAAKTAKKFSDVIIVSGRYEGIDARVKKIFKMEEVSIGPFVLTGGELPAMILIDVMSRQVEGVLGNFDSLEEKRVGGDSYTRPEVFEYKGKKYRVPKVLLGGDHKKIEEWKKKRREK